MKLCTVHYNQYTYILIALILSITRPSIAMSWLLLLLVSRLSQFEEKTDFLNRWYWALQSSLLKPSKGQRHRKYNPKYETIGWIPPYHQSLLHACDHEKRGTRRIRRIRKQWDGLNKMKPQQHRIKPKDNRYRQRLSLKILSLLLVMVTSWATMYCCLIWWSGRTNRNGHQQRTLLMSCSINRFVTMMTFSLTTGMESLAKTSSIPFDLTRMTITFRERIKVKSKKGG